MPRFLGMSSRIQVRLRQPPPHLKSHRVRDSVAMPGAKETSFVSVSMCSTSPRERELY